MCNPAWINDMFQKRAKASTGQAQDWLLEESGKFSLRSRVEGHCKKEMLRLEEALTSIEQMVQPPSVQDLTRILHRCRALKNLVYTKRLYACMRKSGLEGHRSLGNYLVLMLVQVGSMCEAQQVFNKLVDPNVYSWTSFISGYIECGESQQALNLYQKMQEDGVHPDMYTYLAILKACARLKDGERGREVHAEITRKGLERNLFLGNSLVDMYAKCDKLAEAREAFVKLPVRDKVSWTALMVGYAEHGLGEETLDFLEQMKLQGLSPDAATFACSLKACGSIGATDKGQEIHAEIARQGLYRYVVVGSTLVDMYAKFGSLAEAREAFDKLPVRNVVSWNVLMAGYAEHGLGEDVLNCLEQMRLEGLSPDAVTFVWSLKACASIRAIDKGQEMHAEIVRKGLENHVSVGNTLVDMYAKCGSLAEARQSFDKLPVQDVVSWSALLAGYADHGLGEDSLNCLEQMQLEGLSPNAVTFSCSLKACGSIGAINKGREIHTEIVRKGLGRHLLVGNTVVDMYAQCATLIEAQEVFDKLPGRDVVSWSTLMAGYAQLGKSRIVFYLLERMTRQGVKPNGVTFSIVLSVCSHSGLVDKGQKYFEAMSKDYGITPTIEHHTGMVDLLGRAGQLEEAVAMVKNMPSPPNIVVWLTVLGACQKWGNVELGRLAFEQALQLDEKDDAAYILMSNIYADAHMHVEEMKIEAMLVEGQVLKKPGQSWWTDIGSTVHSFLVGDTSAWKNG